MGIEKQGSKPSGYLGLIIGRLMNKFHTSMYVNYIKDNLPVNNSTILDIGCGGGKFIRYLSKANDSYTLYGLDHSPEMVELSKKVNHNAIDRGQVKVFQSSVVSVSLEDKIFDLVTAFETIQFWTDIEKSLTEINRLLKHGGVFLIINRYPEEGSKWWKMAVIKSADDYKMKLSMAGFQNIVIDSNYRKNWIVVKATK
ncbi:MAG: class I SAM-dependent methyltransferase [Prolixibacteraceae bacterium]|nr:class I SAM-dependent methyltransferase [Prolixibacteraceae bacterium]